MMTKAFILVSTATLALGLGPAIAGPCTTEIENLTKTLAATDAGSGPTGAAGGRQAAAGEHPPTAVMGKETEGKAASPEDVRRQTQGQPTAAEQEKTGRAATGAGTMDQARAALERARSLDQQGKEADCMSSVREAKQLSGSK